LEKNGIIFLKKTCELVITIRFINKKILHICNTGGKFMEDKKKGKVEDTAEKTGQFVGKVGKKGWGAVKGFGKGVKDGVSKKKKD